MESRRTFLATTALAAVTMLGSAILESGSEPRAQAAPRRTLYVWYRRGQGYRWRGVGPYTYDEAHRVEDDYIRKGYQTYIGGRNG